MARSALAQRMVFDGDDAEREPFGAYLGDDAATAAAQAVARQRGWTWRPA